MKTMTLKDGDKVLVEVIIGDNSSVSTESYMFDESDVCSRYNSAMVGIESFILALAEERVNVGTPAFERALNTARDACSNNLVDKD